jgi:hypothetical protein
MLVIDIGCTKCSKRAAKRLNLIPNVFHVALRNARTCTHKAALVVGLNSSKAIYEFGMDVFLTDGGEFTLL